MARVPGKRASATQPGLALGGVFVARDESHRTGACPVGEGDAGIRRGAQRGRHAGHHLKGNARGPQSFGFFPAAAEQEWIATFEAHYSFARERGVDQQLVNRCIAVRMARRQFRDAHALRVRRGMLEHVRGDESVVKHEVRLLQTLDGSQRQQAGVAGTGADQGYQGFGSHQRPISFSNSFSVSTVTPSSRALSSLLPASSPATR
jgi:hypothetical protein